jgi:hypothetical protein
VAAPAMLLGLKQAVSVTFLVFGNTEGLLLNLYHQQLQIGIRILALNI